MNLSYKWLTELVDTDADPVQLGEMLTHAGCAVEEIHPAAGGDTMLVGEVTTNRPDWLCHNGVAHEIAALTGVAFTPPEWELRETGPDVNTLTSVTVTDEAKTFCPRYTARILRGITVKESPDWLKQRLEAIGQRPINNIVDVTNLVCFEMNQPLHAFDLNLLSEGRIVVRMAEKDEPFSAITGEQCKLTPEMLVIADAQKAVALAGVKGGSNSEVHAGTTDILIESAWFQPQQVRRSSRASRMDSESSYRYERGIDPGMTAAASARAAQLMQELAGGELATGIIDTHPTLAEPWEVEMRFERCDKILGVHIEHVDCEQVFRGLGLEILHRDASAIRVRVPTFRQDLTREIDLIEEVIRVTGYDRVPTTVTMPLQRPRISSAVTGARLARQTLTGLGYFETYNDAFVPESFLTGYPISGSYEAVRVMNPVNHERPMLRSTLIPSLLEIRGNNRLERDVRLFDLNHVYHGAEEPREPVTLALLDDRGTEYVRGAFEELLSCLHIEADVTFRPVDAGAAFQPGSAAEVRIGTECVGMAGLVTPNECGRHGIDEPPAVLEVDFGHIAALPRATRLARPLPRFPAIRRDIALVVPEAIRWAEIEACIRQQTEHLEDVRFESIFRGKGLQADEKSVAFRMVFRSPERSLTDEEANVARDAIVERLTATISGARLR